MCRSNQDACHKYNSQKRGAASFENGKIYERTISEVSITINEGS